MATLVPDSSALKRLVMLLAWLLRLPTLLWELGLFAF